MSLVVAAQLVAKIVNVGLPADVETDTNTATDGTLNVLVPSQAGNFALVSIEPVPASVLSQLTNGDCTLVISQGAGTLSVTTTA